VILTVKSGEAWIAAGECRLRVLLAQCAAGDRQDLFATGYQALTMRPGGAVTAAVAFRVSITNWALSTTI
jgi:hypothetical protein